MILYDMLDKTLASQEVWIFTANAYDQNSLLFKGEVEDARRDLDNLWPYLNTEIEQYDCSYGILDIRVKDELYNSCINDWDTPVHKRSWLYSLEIDKLKEKEKEN